MSSKSYNEEVEFKKLMEINIYNNNKENKIEIINNNDDKENNIEINNNKKENQKKTILCETKTVKGIYYWNMW